MTESANEIFERVQRDRDRLRVIIERARQLAWDLYQDRTGLEEDGERIAEIHNLLSESLRDA